MCVECRLGNKDADTMRKILKHVKDVGGSLARKARNAQLDVHNLHHIASSVMQKLGGLDEFATMYYVTLKQMLEDPSSKASPKQKLEWLYSIVRMHEAASKELRDLNVSNTNDMSLEELEAELGDIVEQEVRQRLQVYDETA